LMIAFLHVPHTMTKTTLDDTMTVAQDHKHLFYFLSSGITMSREHLGNIWEPPGVWIGIPTSRLQVIRALGPH
jgi:hypothetical protein